MSRTHRRRFTANSLYILGHFGFASCKTNKITKPNEEKQWSTHTTKLQLTSNSKIPVPSLGIDFIPPPIRESIFKESRWKYECTSELRNDLKQPINVTFVTSSPMPAKVLSSRLHKIAEWITFVKPFIGNKRCTMNGLHIWCYFTKHAKLIPPNQLEPIRKIHVNTGFTTSCPESGDIVIFREEEWFKVLIHESFHVFGLDFSHMNETHEVTLAVQRIFPVIVSVNLFEAYTESWACILNALLLSNCNEASKRTVKNKTNRKKKSTSKTNNPCLFLFEQLMKAEAKYKVFQMVKILRQRNLTYSDICNPIQHLAKDHKENKWEETTNVFAYYVLAAVVVFHWESFMKWCQINNSVENPFQFKCTRENIMAFNDFIFTHHNSPHFLRAIRDATMHHGEMKNPFMLSTARMSACEGSD